MRITSRTPSSSSMSRGSTSARWPTAPSTVWLAPVERCTSNPISTSRSITCWICSSLDPSCMTTTMASCVPLIPGWRGLRFLVLFVHYRALDGPRFIEDALKQPADGGVRQRPGVRTGGSLDDLALAVRLVERLVRLALQFPHLDRALRTLVEQAHELSVNLVNSAAPVLDGHRVPPGGTNIPVCPDFQDR